MSASVVLAWDDGLPTAADVEVLSPAERTRYQGMRSENAAACFLGARVLVRTMLSQWDRTVAPSEWRFESGASGKPMVVAPQRASDVHFNVAHTNGLVVAAVSNVPVGVDVEDRRRDARIEKIARRFFAPEEADWVLALPERERRAAFFEVWVMKEAVVKSRGHALGDHLASLAFIPAETGVSPAAPLPGYTLRRYEFGPFLMALAVADSEAGIRVQPPA